MTHAAARAGTPTCAPTALPLLEIRLVPKRSTETPARGQPETGKATAASGPALKFRIRVVDGETIAVGPGKIDLLEAIALTGSITAAARHLDMSYRRAWLLLDELNRSLRAPAVESAKGGTAGGGSVLTEVGRELITLYRRIEETARSSNARDIQRLMTLVAR